MTLTPHESITLSEFDDFPKLAVRYLDEFLYLVLFDPTNPLVSDYTPTSGERKFVFSLWNNETHDVRGQLIKIIKFKVFNNSINTAEKALHELQLGTAVIIDDIYSVLKSQLPLLYAERF